MSHEEYLEGMKLFILEKDDLRELGGLVLFEGLLSERLDFTFVSTGRLRSGVVFNLLNIMTVKYTTIQNFVFRSLE